MSTQNGNGAQPVHTVTDYDVVIIGAGIAGLYQLYRLRKSGLRARAFEAGGDIGGTWFWNRYPGARVDSQSHIYQYWFSQEIHRDWGWSERFCAQPELERYLHFIADRCQLWPDIQLNTRVCALRYEESARRWHVTLDDGEQLTTRFVVSCAGMLSAPLTDLFPGQGRFRGELYHTARWPQHAVTFSGKRVGVIGTGATGIQVIQTIAPLVEELKVFQRTPQYTIQMNNPPFTDADRRAHREQYWELKARVHSTFAGFDYDFLGSYHALSPSQRREIMEERWRDGSLAFWVGTFPEVLLDEQVNAEFTRFVRDKMRARIERPEVAAKLIPTSYGFGTRRVPLETHYLEAFNRNNVELVDIAQAPIQEITERGLRTTTREYDLDMLIFATGFDAATGALTRIDIQGRGGVTLKEKWSRDIRTALGLQIHGFPNLFTTAAPLAPSAAFCNMTTCLQQQVDWITDTILFLCEHHRQAIEPTAEKEQQWVEHHEQIANSTLLVKTDSWYLGTNVAGKQRRLLSYVGGVGAYRQVCDEVKASGYQGFVIS
ncbi:MAG: NAD(P)/FAD-dependent oxidoreductase [Sinobacteraceae bacterium]|nr:NAD(P)/FAD-dependent oxidoreductase [Nevskiaceae bacterium]